MCIRDSSNSGGNAPNFSNVVSLDGSRIFWTDTKPGANMERIFMRTNGAETVAVSTGPAKYWTATTNGRFAFYTEEGALWRYDTVTRERQAVVPEGASGEPADVQAVLGVNVEGGEGDTVYFVATGVLAANRNAVDEGAEAGADNLYVNQFGTTKFIARLAPGDDNLRATEIATESTYGDWAPDLGSRTAEVSPDGGHLLFESTRSLTGYNNVDAANGELEVEAYRYSLASGELSCMSCAQSGAQPEIAVPPGVSLLHISSNDTYVPRWMSNDGARVFFDSLQSLTVQDTNERRDVYEWEQEGSTGCPTADPARPSGGGVFLLSGGTAAITRSSSMPALRATMYFSRAVHGSCQPITMNRWTCMMFASAVGSRRRPSHRRVRVKGVRGHRPHRQCSGRLRA